MATSLTLQNDASLAQGYVKVNGTTSATFTTSGLSTPQATIGSITGILKASSGVVSQAVAGTDYLTSSSGGAITLATAQTATGTAVDFTGIPSWVKRITVMFNGVSTSTTTTVSSPLIQIGDSSGIKISGYTGACSINIASSGAAESLSTGFKMSPGANWAIASVVYGYYTLCLVDAASNIWSLTGQVGRTDTAATYFTAGTASLLTTLTQIRITTVNSTDTFDAGTINISYE